LDRFDLVVSMDVPDLQATTSGTGENNTQTMAESVLKARHRARHRQQGVNASLSRQTLEDLGVISSAADTLLNQVARQRAWSARVVDRLRRVALTVADLDDSGLVSDLYMAQAIDLRRALDLPDALAHE
jgi:magnesium chelatase family protein